MSILFIVARFIRKHPVIALLIVLAIIAVPIILIVLIAQAVMSAIFGGGSSQQCSSGGSGAGIEVSGKNNEAKIYNFLVGKEHFSAAGAAGATAVAYRESNYNPAAVNPGGGVAGIWQWSGWGGTQNGDRIHAGGFIKSKSDLTLSNEFKLADKELHGGYSKALKVCKSESDPGQAAMDWSQYYEGVSTSDGQTKSSMITSQAKQIYQRNNGNHGSVSDSADTAGSGSNCGGGDDDSSDSSILQAAKYYQKKFHGGSYGGASVSHFLATGEGVCTTFVSAVLQKAGYGQLSSLYCPTISDHIKNGGTYGNLKGISSSDAEPGDIVNEYGHIMILCSKWHGKTNSTKVIDLRSGTGHGGIYGPEGYHDADLSDLSNTPYFAKPIKK